MRELVNHAAVFFGAILARAGGYMIRWGSENFFDDIEEETSESSPRGDDGFGPTEVVLSEEAERMREPPPPRVREPEPAPLRGSLRERFGSARGKGDQ